MGTTTAMRERHAVRSYLDRPIEDAKLLGLQAEIDACNQEGNLSIQLICNEEKAFGGFMAKYGKFEGVRNYLVMVGEKSDDLDVRVGYYGERIVLRAQELGLNTCWVALSFSKGKTVAKIQPNERLSCVITLGYGKTSGSAHTSKKLESLYRTAEEPPRWFFKGMEAALLAPTALNQQKFRIDFTGTDPSGKGLIAFNSTGGFYAQIDRGIVTYHFEQGAGADNFIWI